MTVNMPGAFPQPYAGKCRADFEDGEESSPTKCVALEKDVLIPEASQWLQIRNIQIQEELNRLKRECSELENKHKALKAEVAKQAKGNSKLPIGKRTLEEHKTLNLQDVLREQASFNKQETFNERSYRLLRIANADRIKQVESLEEDNRDLKVRIQSLTKRNDGLEDKLYAIEQKHKKEYEQLAGKLSRVQEDHHGIRGGRSLK